ncbi:uncharacterized protein LOC135841114 [Planococcus citri]|uniref:uncharacterized protein LOC135841114 n=1 Tax=Planococcus citri TaxID=170843 RepID=UPI0031FA3A57
MLLFKNFHRAVSIILLLTTIALIIAPSDVNRQVLCQDGGFELPVQLIGFPVIIMAVRMSNFVKKLAYSLNPSTYRRNVRRTRGVAVTEPPLNLAKADSELLQQLGPNFCVYENVCLNHVKSSGTKTPMDWEKIIRDYSQLPQNNQQFYLLSVFLGDIIGSAKLCQHFTETGRICH